MAWRRSFVRVGARAFISSQRRATKLGHSLPLVAKFVRTRCDLENQIRGVLRTFGILFGKRVGGLAKRAEEIIDGELDASPTIQAVVEALMRARANILEQIRHLEAKVRLIARQNKVVRRLMSVPGVGVITALGFAATIDDPTRFKRSSNAGPTLV